MRSIYRFSVIALAVGALALFGLAKPGHAEVKVAGVVWAGIGVHKITPDSGNGSTDVRSDGLGEINFSGGVGNVTGRVRYRVVGEQSATGGQSKTPAAVRHDVTWKVSDSLSLVFAGQSFGLPEALNAYLAYTQGVFTSQGDIGDLFASPEAFFVNTGGLDVRGSFGTVDAGIMINGNCEPACGSADGQAKTLIPHLMMKAGSTTIAFYYAAADGKVTATGATPKSNEFSINARLKSGTMDFGVEYVGGKDSALGQNKVTLSDGTTKVTIPDGSKFTGLGIGGKFGAVGFHYTSRQWKPSAGSNLEDVNEITVAYTMPLTEQSEFVLGLTQFHDKVLKYKNMLLLASAKTTF